MSGFRIADLLYSRCLCMSKASQALLSWATSFAYI